ncbi:hypothetical protein G6F22_020107 [Rhizopus arrhizus]|nr:hypothetical protein G6F22_020107 [Rhizopus arrhizus]
MWPGRRRRPLRLCGAARFHRKQHGQHHLRRPETAERFRHLQLDPDRSLLRRAHRRVSRALFRAVWPQRPRRPGAADQQAPAVRSVPLGGGVLWHPGPEERRLRRRRSRGRQRQGGLSRHRPGPFHRHPVRQYARRALCHRAAGNVQLHAGHQSAASSLSAA